jgi:hypothetical protein
VRFMSNSCVHECMTSALIMLRKLGSSHVIIASQCLTWYVTLSLAF